jgi:hypothetical protein
MTVEDAAKETLKAWGVAEAKGVAFLMAWPARYIKGLIDQRDPYDNAPVYRRALENMTWQEKAKDRTFFFFKCGVPFLSASVQSYSKGLPQDVALRNILDKWAGKGALGIYDITLKDEIVLIQNGKKMSFTWDSIKAIDQIKREDSASLGELEKAFVASGKNQNDYINSPEAQKIILGIYDKWVEYDPILGEEKNEDLRIQQVYNLLAEQINNLLTDEGTVSNWYKVKLDRAKTDEEKKVLAEEYKIVRQANLLDTLKRQPKAARTLFIIKQFNESKLPWKARDED